MKDEENVASLRACVRDLAALSALPSLWTSRAPDEAVNSFLDVLLSALKADLAYARLDDPRGGEPIEAARTSGRTLEGSVEHVVRLLRSIDAPASTTIADPTG